MLKNIVKIQYNSDFTLNCKLPNGYDNQDFIIRLYTTDKDNYFEASYLNGEYENCLTDSDNHNIVVYVNNHNLQPGCLHVGLQFDYDNTHFSDNVENIITAEETNVYLVKQNANATSAMYVGSALPDLTGSTDFITQSDLEFELLNYYTKEEIDNANYISSSDLNDYVTEEELNDMGFLSQAQLDAMGYATTSYVETKTNQKQDRLISAVNIKTVNGYSLLGNGDLVIEGGGSSIDMSAYVTHTFLQNQAYVTQNALNNASYVTSSQLNNASYATQSFVDDAIADAMTEINVPTYTSDLTNDSGFITASDLNGYATETYVADYVATHSGPIDLSAYVSKDELNQMGYITTSDVSQMGYVTSSDLSQASYVTSSDLSNMGYITMGDVSACGYITSIPAEYVTESELSAKGYITSIPSEYVTQSQLSANSYVTESEIAGMGYVTSIELSNAGYITSIPSEYITESELSAKGYITSIPAEYVTESELSAMSYATTSQLPNMSDYVTETSLANMSYVTETALSNKGYLTSIPSEYVTESELSAKSYATTSQLAGKQDTLVSGTNIKTINNNSLLGSGNVTISASGNLITEVTQAEYDAMEQAGTLDPNTLYVITDAPATDLSYYAELTYVDTYYVSKSALSNMGYATETYVSDYVAQHAPTPDLSAYVTKTELNNASYVTQTQLNNAGYLTSIPNTYATYAAISNMGYVTQTQLNNAGYLTSANFIYDSSTYTLTISI